MSLCMVKYGNVLKETAEKRRKRQKSGETPDAVYKRGAVLPCLLHGFSILLVSVLGRVIIFAAIL